MLRGRKASSIQSTRRRSWPSNPGNFDAYTPRQRSHAGSPVMRTPRISATALRRPSEANFPSPEKVNALGVPPRSAARMFAAQVLAWRSACWAVGGDVVPSARLTRAQSPRAHTPLHADSRCSFTGMRPCSATGSVATTGCGPAGTVATHVAAAIVSVSLVVLCSSVTLRADIDRKPTFKRMSIPRFANTFSA